MKTTTTDNPGKCIIDDEWKTIDSAPKDGSEIILYCKREGAYIGRWMDQELEGHAYKNFNNYGNPHFEPKLLFYHGCGECCQDPFPPEPTHWMSLTILPKD